MPLWGMLRITRLRMVTLSMSWLCARNARLRVVARRPAGAVEDRAVLADERIAGLRRDGAPQVMGAGSEAERGVPA